MTDTGKVQQFLNSTKGSAALLSLALMVGAIGGTSSLLGPQSTACAVGNELGLSDIPLADCSTGLDIEQKFGINQHVTVTHYRDIDNDGELEKVDTLADRERNLLVDQGKNFYQSKIAGTSFPSGADLFSNATYIALSNESSPEAGDVGLQGEFTSGGLQRGNCRASEGTYINLGVGNYSCSVTFTASSTFNNVNMTGLMWNGTQGSDSLVAEVGFKSANILDDDQIVANWTEISFTEAP